MTIVGSCPPRCIPGKGDLSTSLRATLSRVDWEGHAEREEERYADGAGRLPDEPHAREKQLVRIAMAATGAGLARLMQGRRAEAVGWFGRSAERFRESAEHAPREVRSHLSSSGNDDVHQCPEGAPAGLTDDWTVAVSVSIAVDVGLTVRSPRSR